MLAVDAAGYLLCGAGAANCEGHLALAARRPRAASARDGAPRRVRRRRRARRRVQARRGRGRRRRAGRALRPRRARRLSYAATAASASRASSPAVCCRSPGAFASARSTASPSDGRKLGPEVEQGGRRFVDVRPQLVDVAVLVVQHGARERAVEDAAERVDVGAGVDVDALRLLGRHVVGGADREAGLREAGGPDAVHGDPEVGEEGVLDAVARGDQDVAPASRRDGRARGGGPRSGRRRPGRRA